jgi:subtilisin family serine protease
MAQYVLVNRRSGLFTTEAKLASRASIASAMALVPQRAVVDDHAPSDKLARRVVVLELDDTEATNLASRLSADSVLEPLIHRKLHYRRPSELRNAVPLQARTTGITGQYQVTITGNGTPLADIDVMFYVADRSGSISIATQRTTSNGRASMGLASDQQIAFVEPIPYAGFWIMLAEAPPSGSTIECIPIHSAPADGRGWWHAVTSTGDTQDGAGINIGVIDTGCGPHPNLQHVKLAGVFTNGQSLPASQATDVAEHGTHTTGLIGARKTKSGDFTGMAPASNLFHVRVFESEDQGPTQADLISAIDTLSRENGCDLINMSLGGGPPSGAEQDCIRDALERGTLCICSAGNDAGPINYPAAYPESAAVSALGQVGWAPSGTFSAGNRPRETGRMGRNNLFIASFSSYGDGLDAAGPGVGIVSTVPDRAGGTDLYMEMDGTSMASPAICATLAVLLSRDPAFARLPRDRSRSHAAREILETNCISLGLSRAFQGYGIPVVRSQNAPVPSNNSARPARKRKTRR